MRNYWLNRRNRYKVGDTLNVQLDGEMIEVTVQKVGENDLYFVTWFDQDGTFRMEWLKIQKPK